MNRTIFDRLLATSLLLSLIACNNADDAGKTGDTGKAGNDADAGSRVSNLISDAVVKTFPHDTSSFTQGLVIYKGSLYEGTGEYGHSRLLKIDMATGKKEKELALDSIYFGEGITVLNDTIYQLTWQEKKVFAYTVKDFRKVKEFAIATEGWGITTNGTDLIVSDGSNNLYYYNPSTFQLLRTQSITEGGSPSYNLNELEFIDGHVYANQWQAPYIFKIDPGSGTVVGKIDLTNSWNRIKMIDPAADVPNGIAYDPATKQIYVTGKKWPELYEIQLGK